MKGDEITGKAVVSIEDGGRLGRVDELLVDLEVLRVAALHIEAAGEETLVPFAAVRAVGRDAVTVPDGRAAQRADPGAEDLTTLTELGKLKVVDEAGTYLGTVRGVAINPHTGAITELETHRGGLLGLGDEAHTVLAAEVTSVGVELLIVQAPDPLTVAPGDTFTLVKRQA